MVLHDVKIDETAITEFCRENGIRELLLFGSITRDDFNIESDVDVLVDFLPGKKPDLWNLIGLQMSLGEQLGREVHLHTPPMIDPRMRARALRTARVVYAT